METTAFDGLFCFCQTKHTTLFFFFFALHYYYILLCFWALGVIVPFYFRSLGSFATRTHMDVTNRLSGSYQFDIRINNVPVTNEDPTVKGATCGGMSGDAVKSTNCLPSPSKHAHMRPPLQLLTWRAAATSGCPHLKFACEGIASYFNAGWYSWVIHKSFCKVASLEK